jgi:lysyl-tRNA synthetase class 2
VTYHNALDRSLFLRIAIELHLKRLVVGGFERVYEIGRVFRNEGISTKHNPEYTMLEVYQAYADYHDIMRLVEEMVAHVAEQVLGHMQLPYGDHEIDLTPPWRRLTLREAILEHSDIDFEAHPDAESLRRAMAGVGVEAPAAAGRGKLIDELLSTFVEPKLIQPTFLLDYPVELSPLAKRKGTNLVERFGGFAGVSRQRLSELNDPRPARAVRRAGPPAAAGDEVAETGRDYRGSGDGMPHRRLASH